jgi:hypothetical protein
MLSLLTGLILGAGCQPSPSIQPTPTRPSNLGAGLVSHTTYPSLSYGIQAFLWWNPYLRARDLELIRQMRFDYVKQTFYWADLQPDSKTPIDWSRPDDMMDEIAYRGIKVIARLSLAPDWAVIKPSEPDQPPYNLDALAAYCGGIAARYKGRIAGYQVWNEPNLDREWAGYPPNAAAYVKLLKVCGGAIRNADPAAILITAGLAPTGGAAKANSAIADEQYMRDLFTAGISPYYDVMGLNASGYKSPPETPPDDPSVNGNRWMVFRHVEDMRALMVAYGDGAKQVAILEMGWTTDQRPNTDYSWYAVSEETQATYLVGAYRYAAAHWRPWVGLMVTLYIPDPAWTPDREEYWWAIMTPGYTLHLRPAYFALANMDRHTDDVDIPDQPPGEPHYTPLPPRKK